MRTPSACCREYAQPINVRPKKDPSGGSKQSMVDEAAAICDGDHGGVKSTKQTVTKGFVHLHTVAPWFHHANILLRSERCLRCCRSRRPGSRGTAKGMDPAFVISQPPTSGVKAGVRMETAAEILKIIRATRLPCVGSL